MNDSPGQREALSTAGRTPTATVVAALDEHSRWLRTVLAARGVERHAIDDVFQEVTAAALAGAEQLRDPHCAPAWLYRLAILQVLQYRRRTGRRRQLIDRYAASGAAADTADYDPLAWLLADEEQRLVRRALAELPPRDAEILLLKYAEDASYRQLAERLGITVAAVEARLHRARTRLRSALTQLAPELASHC